MNNINIEDLTIKQARELAALFSGSAVPTQNDCPYEIGKTYMFRTGTVINTGVVVRVTSQEIVIKDAAWIADTGRFSDALKSGDFSEVEPFPDGEVIVGRNFIADACKISKAPRSQK